MASKPREFPLSVVDILARSFVFAGRSRRRELFDYWLALALIGLAVSLGGSPLGWPLSQPAREIAGTLLTLPMIALFVRRLHDQDRSGWWGLLLAPLILVDLYEDIGQGRWGFDPHWPSIERESVALALVAMPYLLALIFALMPGSPDANRYGPDPRIEEPESQPAAVED